MADRRSPLAQVLYVAFRHSPESTPDLWEAMAIAAREHLSAAPPAAPTERPTCATCFPHFDNLGRTPSDRDQRGTCRRFPKPEPTGPGDSCGEHVDMATWIASRRAPT